MDGPAMSGHERQILASIEADLRTDARLEKRLSTMRAGWLVRSRLAVCAVRLSTLIWLLAWAAGFLVVSVREPSVAGLVVLALSWAAVLVAAGGLVARRRRSGR
ncbi:hypothetical protein OG871_03435 [Kitasatospora sp. NBC_00374]|uniref:hypothetical protein n=1 Tax=Kitasatospora sp. NBC_00374 TaxID=2975964 RepID=UPI0030E06EAE